MLPPHTRFFVGLTWALVFSLVLWLAILWAASLVTRWLVYSLFA